MVWKLNVLGDLGQLGNTGQASSSAWDSCCRIRLCSSCPKCSLCSCRLMQHDSWLQQQLADPANQGSPFWQAMQLVMAQLWGMRDGYNARVSAEGAALGIDFISQREWLTLNTMGDMDDLLELLFPDDPQLGAAHLADMEPAALRAHLATRGAVTTVASVVAPHPVATTVLLDALQHHALHACVRLP